MALVLYAMRLPDVVGVWAVTTCGLATASTGSVCAFGNNKCRDHMLDNEMASSCQLTGCKLELVSPTRSGL